MHIKKAGLAGTLLAIVTLITTQYFNKETNQRSVVHVAKPGLDKQHQRKYLDSIPIFWNKLYSSGGETLYCGKKFNGNFDRAINIEHVMPMSWAIRKFKCTDRASCRKRFSEFNRLESDMHNLYPALKNINRLRGSYPFAIISGESRQFGRCDFEISKSRRVVEPRESVRGNIARSILYMHHVYGIKIRTKQGNLLKKWNLQDLPDNNEKRRNNRIEKIQGNRNPFIDNPELSDNFNF